MTDFHGDDEGDIGGSSVRSGGAPQDPGGPRMLLTLDVDDHIDPASRDWLTLDENGRIVRTPEHEKRAGEIGIKFEAWRGKHEDFNAAQGRWANLIGNRVRADAMDMNAFGEWNFDEHPFAALGGYDEARRVFGGKKPLDRMIAEINAAVFGQGEADGEPEDTHGGER